MPFLSVPLPVPLPGRCWAGSVALALALSLGTPVAADVTPVHGDAAVPLQPYPDLDLARYAGVWYEIARFPNRHQRNCAQVTAEYATRPDGHFAVRGTCPDRLGRAGATVREGVARLDGPAELSIGINAWMPLFRRTVVVLDVSPDYAVAVIGEPRRKYGWIMARRPELSRAEYERAAAVLARNGYWVELLEPVAPVR
jgi:apolipoprotein D and lipocalin family protein